MTKMIFLNLPVANLARSTEFFDAIGCEKNPNFSNENASCMVWSDSIYFMLLTHEFYSSFTHKPIADAHNSSASLICLMRDTKADVDQMTELAGANGGTADIRPAQDLGFMYSRAFDDPDGNTFEVAWMDPAAAEQGAPDAA